MMQQAKALKYPKISIVMPSFNQAKFLEQAILSIINQNYPNLEYVIIDGGSTDGSVDIIRKYEKYLHYWISERDRGQSHALNKGFEKTTGEIMAYLNSDDLYCPWTFKTVASLFSEFSETKWLTSLRALIWNADGEPIENIFKRGYTQRAFYGGRTLSNHKEPIGWIMQEATFWNRWLWDAAGGYISEHLTYAMDFDLWARFYEYADLTGVTVPLGGFRLHGNQKSADLENYYRETTQVLNRYGFNEDKLNEMRRQCPVIYYNWKFAKRVLAVWSEEYLNQKAP